VFTVDHWVLAAGSFGVLVMILSICRAVSRQFCRYGSALVLFLNASYMEFVCFSKFCASVFASFSCVVFRMVLLESAMLRLERNFFGVVFQVLHVLQDVFVAQAFCAERLAAQISDRTTDSAKKGIAERVNRFMGSPLQRNLFGRPATKRIALRTVCSGIWKRFNVTAWLVPA
jgi:hypothetical protein